MKNKHTATSWKPGQSGNPAGRQLGSRNRLNEKFILALHDDFVEHGTAVIERVRKTKPEIYLKVIASILPRELHFKNEFAFEGLTDDRLDEAIGSVRAVLLAATQQAGTEQLPNIKRKLISFTEFTYPRYETATIHRQIAEQLERVECGEIDRLMLLVPPRHGKSELASRRFPAWFLGKHPEKQFISASASATLAEDFGRDVRNLIASQEYAQIFDTRLAGKFPSEGPLDDLGEWQLLRVWRWLCTDGTWCSYLFD